MKNSLLTTSAIVIFVALVTRYSYSQSFEEYVKSFKKTEGAAVISFGKVIQNNNQMTREEALKFVYFGNISKLTCIQEQYNLVTEKSEGLSKYLNLPSKNMLLDMKEFFIIANSSYDCNNPKKPSVNFLTLTIVNRQYNRMDSLVVYREKYDFPEVLGEINSLNGNIFLVGYLKTPWVDPSDPKATIYARLLTIDKNSLKFKILKETSDVKGDYTNFSKTLKNLGWEQTFIGY
jgi:hypothetical protein